MFQLQNHWVAMGFNCKVIGWLWVSVAKPWVALGFNCKIIGGLQNHSMVTMGFKSKIIGQLQIIGWLLISIAKSLAVAKSLGGYIDAKM